MLNISDYPVHQSEKQRWGNCARLCNELEAFNNRASADNVFKYLNRPLPDGVNPRDDVDVSVLMPPLYTAAELAEKADKSIHELTLWLDKYSDGTDVGGQDADGNYLYYWEHLESELSPELMTVNRAAEVHRIDKRTVKRRVDEAVSRNMCAEPVIKTEGSREYKYYRVTDLQRVLR